MNNRFEAYFVGKNHRPIFQQFHRMALSSPGELIVSFVYLIHPVTESQRVNNPKPDPFTG
ncbi:MAG: hypothetical protein HN778_10540 [Prolixibacteraceae bacterium]|nr:hypothetical protein [Prolixibacteraceae bacterium]MBT6004204.1 hypothetical protein [Prolixibacteraceae bacterium]MBT6998043.1 hypothetical protein [Prolixibacteraceae bacterium]MBT7395260.1 hypothetical protein [Prolixibacteraceae bacterium]